MHAVVTDRRLVLQRHDDRRVSGLLVRLLVRCGGYRNAATQQQGAQGQRLAIHDDPPECGNCRAGPRLRSPCPLFTAPLCSFLTWPVQEKSATSSAPLDRTSVNEGKSVSETL